MFKFIKTNTKDKDVWGLVIENLEQLKEYAKVVAYPKSCLIAKRLLERIEFNEERIKDGGYPITEHWGDKLVSIANKLIQLPENENITVIGIKTIMTGIMVDPKQKMIENGQSILIFGFPFSQFPRPDIKIIEEKTLDHIPVKFVDYYKTSDYCGIIFNVDNE